MEVNMVQGIIWICMQVYIQVVENLFTYIPGYPGFHHVSSGHRQKCN